MRAPGGSEGVERMRRLLGDIITTPSCCRGWKGQKQCQVVEKETTHMLWIYAKWRYWFNS